MAFPSNPSNGQIYKNYKYNSTKGAWIYSSYIGYDEDGNVIIEPVIGRKIVFDDSETWHEVGASGEPTFENGWAVTSSSVRSLRFRKDAMGYVHIEGLASATNATDITIFTLPVGYRPSKQLYFAGAAWNGSNHTHVEISILTTGAVRNADYSGTYDCKISVVFYPD